MQSRFTTRYPAWRTCCMAARRKSVESRPRFSVCGIGKPFADVPLRQCPQQCVGDGVQQDVRVAVADQMLVVIDLNSAQSQRPAGRQAMGVVADPDP